MSPISCVFTLSAFSRESLMDVRWFLDGLPKTTGLCAHWHSILKMGSTKQAMFLDRIFHLHDIQRRRAGRACVTRLSQEQWVAEIDSICVQTYIYDNMVISKDPKGNPQFSLETLKKVKLGIMEGDFADDAANHLLAKDPNFKPSDSSMWQDNAPPTDTLDPTSGVPLGAADDKLQNLSKDARQKAWEHDSLSLARDVSAIAKMHEKVVKNEKSQRLQRIAHVRSENIVGGSVVTHHMEQHAKHTAGTEGDLINVTEQFIASRKSSAGALLVWADLTKFGRLGTSDLNYVVSIAHKALSKMPAKSIAFFIAPHLVSEKVSGGQRGEIRRIEDKFDSRSMLNYLISIRMECPPATKRVSLHMLGWAVMLETGAEDNVFRNSQLLLDRSTRQAVPWASESTYIVPASEKDALPHASEGHRSLSEVQESAQLLTGTDLPNTVLASLFGKLTTSSALVINATPYDGCLESTLLTWHQFNEMKVDFLSISRNVTTLEYVEKKIAFSLLQDFWFLFCLTKNSDFAVLTCVANQTLSNKNN
ncbi:unnamed protein product [Cladocopium goreaui]|uniref:Sodium/hydrogen exchanger 3 n=1 Tax=Cladocopium goreaui TaxID=2562237 RepID=A0A9P1CF78_9DINO|nr:unnamed protein product [Cladocopium goreaui]